MGKWRWRWGMENGECGGFVRIELGWATGSYTARGGDY